MFGARCCSTHVAAIDAGFLARFMRRFSEALEMWRDICMSIADGKVAARFSLWWSRGRDSFATSDAAVAQNAQYRDAR